MLIAIKGTPMNNTCYLQSSRKESSREERGFPGGSVVKDLLANAGDMGSISGSGRSPGERNGNPLQHSSRMEEPDRLQSMGLQRVGHD